jgi:hypothetical protein
MENEKEQLEALQDIRKMMKDSSRFLSLSGLSGVFAGVYALAGAGLGYMIIQDFNSGYPLGGELFAQEYQGLVTRILLTCIGVLGLSIATALYFSNIKAKKNNQRLFDHTSKKLLWSMAVPLAAGGIFCTSLIYHGNGLVLLVSPVMLIFYGLALISSSKFTLHDVKYLGYLEVLLGIAASFTLSYGLIFWALGFGVLHIIYGTIMWFKYDRTV